jgi:DNA polymerase elongation subunit (family B)
VNIRVADPTLNTFEGIKIFGKKSMFIFDNVVDMDFSSMYPHIIIAFNIAPNTMIAKLIISKSIEDVIKDTMEDLTTIIDDEDDDVETTKKTKKVEDEKYDAGKDFMDNLLTDNLSMFGSKWFNLPTIEELDLELQKTFNISDKTVISIDQHKVDKYYLEKMVINI